MKWIYLSLAFAAAIFAALIASHEGMERRTEGIRVCLAASVVNLVIFFAMHWAKKYADKKASNASPDHSK
jgi:hypothetical protein